MGVRGHYDLSISVTAIVWTFFGLLKRCLAVLYTQLIKRLLFKAFKRLLGGVFSHYSMILHACNKAGCKALIPVGTAYCDKHTNSASRYYDRIRMHRQLTRNYRLFYQSQAWRDLRALKLAENPLCEECMKHDTYTIATDVHHVKDVFTYPKDKLKLENLKSLCKSCHERIHKKGYYSKHY